MNRKLISKIGLALLTGICAFVFSGLASAGGVAPTPCGDAFEGELVHFDKIVFRPRDGLKFACPTEFLDPPESFKVITDQDLVDIKVPDDPNLIADLRRKVADFMNQRGCSMVFGDIAVHHSHVVIWDVEYAVGCGLRLSTPAQ